MTPLEANDGAAAQRRSFESLYGFTWIDFDVRDAPLVDQHCHEAVRRISAFTRLQIAYLPLGGYTYS